MYNHDNKEYLAQATALPSNTNVDGKDSSGNVITKFVGKGQGALAVKIVVNTALTIADTKSLTIKIKDSADGVTYADFATIFSQTASGTNMTAIAVGTVLGEEFVLPPSMNKYVKVNIATTDTGTTGKFDIYLRYLAR